MKLGIPFWLGNLRTLDFFIKRTSCDFIELDMETIPKHVIGRLSSKLQAKGIEVAFHGSWIAASLLFGLQKELQKSAIKVLKEQFKLATRLKGAYFIVHLDSAMEGIFRLKRERQILLNSIISSIKKAKRVRGLKKCATAFLIENVSNIFLGKRSVIKRVLEETNSKLCIDIGHAAKHEFRRGKGMDEIVEAIYKWIKYFKHDIFAAHLHNFYVEGNVMYDHVINGLLDLEAICMELARTDCKYVMLEVIRDVKTRKIASLLNRLKEIKTRLA